MRKLTCDAISVMRNKFEKYLFYRVGFSALSGSIIRVLGPNGVGKTTLLRCIARLNDTNTGKILYNNHNVDDYTHEYNSIMCYISDRDQVSNNLTVEETLIIWCKIYGSELAITSAIHIFNLERFLEYRVQQLSKGWKKRLILTRLLLQQKSRIWLLDEPFVNLDTSGKFLLSNLIHTHASNGGITIVADHTDNLDVLTSDQMLQTESKYSKQCKRVINLNIQDFLEK